MAKIISLDQKKQHLKIKGFELENEIVFNYFNGLPDDVRDETFYRALYIGTLALMEDRISAFLSKTQNELSVEMLSLKMIFDMKKEIFYKSAVKGLAAEDDIVEFLNQWFGEHGLKDTAESTGTQAGTMKGNKTGDVICNLQGSDKTIVIEVKFDKSYKLGDVQDKDQFAKKADTAWGQLLEAKANRDSAVSIIVFDKSLVDSGISKAVNGTVGFIKGVGFIAIVDSQSGDFANLAIAYGLARDIAINAKDYDTSPEVLTLIVKRILNDLNRLKKIEKQVDTIQKAGTSILEELTKGMLSVEFTLDYLTKFMADGQLTQEDLFNFYSAEDVKTKYNALDPKEFLSGK